MATRPKLNRPRLVAVWPGMGHVGVNAGIYLLSKLEMTLFTEFDSTALFDLDAVEVKGGLIRSARRPRNRLYAWTDPAGQNDLLVFLGEAQPPAGKQAFCRELLSYARELGVDRVYTFAAMATPMHPEHPSRVFVAATDEALLDELRPLPVKVLEEGQIGGLNGVLLGVAADEGLSGACFLGEMPHIFAQLPFPKGSMAVLEVFATLTGMELDLSELARQAESVEEQLGELLERVQEQVKEQLRDRDDPAADDDEADEELTDEPTDEPTNDAADEPDNTQRVEELFALAAADRSKAFELKRELDRLGLFAKYEDRFLDLFRKPGEGKP
jgi:proteasome assembly chaperone (PAC2) family protein